MADALILKPRAVLDGPPRRVGSAAGEPGLRATAWHGQELVSVMARRDDLARCGIDAPDRPGWRDGWIATGPGRWLAVRRHETPTLGPELEATLGSVAAVVDLSDAYACFSLRGRASREVLAKGVALDLDPAAFGPGAAAVTAIGGVGVVLWCERAGDAFELAVTRSFTGSFLHWLEVSAAAAGLELG